MTSELTAAPQTIRGLNEKNNVLSHDLSIAQMRSVSDQLAIVAEQVDAVHVAYAIELHNIKESISHERDDHAQVASNLKR